MMIKYFHVSVVDTCITGQAVLKKVKKVIDSPESLLERGALSHIVNQFKPLACSGQEPYWLILKGQFLPVVGFNENYTP